MDTHSVHEAFHQIIADFTKSLSTHVETKGEDSSKSFVYFDSKTINLLLLYILMNKELQLTRLTNRSAPVNTQKTMIEEIDRMIVENEKIFEELLNELKNTL